MLIFKLKITIYYLIILDFVTIQKNIVVVTTFYNFLQYLFSIDLQFNYNNIIYDILFYYLRFFF